MTAPIPKPKTPRDAQYLDHVRSHKCAVYGCYNTPVRACHEVGMKGKGIKSPDHLAINLCDAHHNMGPDSIHRLGRKQFEAIHGMDLNEVALELLHEWVTGRTGDVMHFC